MRASAFFFFPKPATDERARTAPVTNYHHKPRTSSAGESGSFYASVLPCSQCRSGEIIGRREQLHRVDGERERKRRGRDWQHMITRAVSSHSSTGAFIIAVASTYGNTTVARLRSHLILEDSVRGRKVVKSGGLCLNQPRGKRETEREGEKRKSGSPKHYPVGER